MNWLREPDTEPIPGYVLVCPLGTGGFGEVWKCVAPGGIHKAIKFVFGNLNSLDDDSVKAEQEFKALERVKAVRHPFVLSMDRIEVVGGELLIVMELADKSLYDVLNETQAGGSPGIARNTLLRYMADAAEGLDHLIEKYSLQHLDVKPKNLFLIADRVKVADFGLVKHLERQSSSGLMGGITPSYAAPETFINKISKNSDQYSLAVVYTELLTGQRPFNGKNVRALALQHMSETPDLSLLPEGDRAAVARALAKEPEDRFPSCMAFIRALGGGLSQSEISLGDISLPTPPPFHEQLLNGDTPVGGTPFPTRNGSKLSPHLVASIPDMDVADPSATMSASVPFIPEEGVLRPAIFIGIGSFGRRALQQVRCRLLDRVGELSHVPCFRYIYVDADPDAQAKTLNGPADAALLPEHTFSATLQPVTAYRRRHLDQMLEWLPREKLYTIPRSLRVDGSRALGRLAFNDHFLRFQNRLRQEIQGCTHPESISQSSDAAGLPVRTTVPAVYLFASASGGTSGMILDVGHAVRRTLEKYGIPNAPLTSFIFAGAPNDTTSPIEELANVYATLTELNHYADPDITYMSRYGGPEGPMIEANGLPFNACYLLPMAERTTEAFRDCISHLAAYVSHDITTPLGGGLEKLRNRPIPVGRTPFRSFGTFGVWFPRGLLLRSAARQLCVRYLRRWTNGLHNNLPADAEKLLNDILADPRLTHDSIRDYIVSESGTGPDKTLISRINEWLAGLATQAEIQARKPEPEVWALAGWDQLRDWIGLEPSSETDSPFRRGRLSRALDVGLNRAAVAWQNEFVEMLRNLDELPGPRVAIREAVINQLASACQMAASTIEKQAGGLAEARATARVELQTALATCEGLESFSTGFALFGNRATRSLRAYADKLKTFAELRIREDYTWSIVRFYRRMGLWMADRLRDLTFARERIGRLADLLEAPVLLPGAGDTPHNQNPLLQTELNVENVHNTLKASNTIRVVLPNNSDHLDRAAAELIDNLPAQSMLRLEQLLTKLVVEPRGGLVGTCRGSADLTRQLGGPMVEQTTAFLAELLPGEDVTTVELSTAGAIPGELGRRVASYLRAAAPLAQGPTEDERTFVVLPDSEPGQQYAQEVIAVDPRATPVSVRGASTDLLFCREQGFLRPADLFRVLEPCWDAYQHLSINLEVNPHSRFDVSNWLPLVE